MEQFLSIVASIASVIAACVAVSSARSSKTFSKEARTIRDEMVRRRGIAELSRIYSETGRILHVVAEVGPTCTPKSLRGKNSRGIADQVQEYSRLLNEHSSHFDQPMTNLAKTLCDALRANIEALAMATDPDSVKAAGKPIYHLIEEFHPEIKRYVDGERERLVRT
jgi:predicted alpha/beta hydrolase